MSDRPQPPSLCGARTARHAHERFESDAASQHESSRTVTSEGSESNRLSCVATSLSASSHAPARAWLALRRAASAAPEPPAVHRRRAAARRSVSAPSASMCS
eukprot:6082465-Prymnesium_polylepis.1